MSDIRTIIEKRIENFTATKSVFDADNNERTSKIYQEKIELLQSILDEADGKTEHITT